MKSVEDLHAALAPVREAFLRLRVPAALRSSLDTAGALVALSQIARRLTDGPRAPIRVALFGPTGSGKSKLFNTLLGGNVSPSSYRRPWTRRPVYAVHEAHQTRPASLNGELCAHAKDALRDLVLIDAPDFDSVESGNRSAAERIYLEADAFIVVCDVHKYADASVWAYLERIRCEGKRCIFVLNKVPERGDAPVEDFRQRLETLFRPAPLPGPLVAIAHLAASDETPLPEGDPGVASLRAALTGLLETGAEGSRSVLAESFRVDLERLLGAWERLSGPLCGYRAGLARLDLGLELRYRQAAEALSTEVSGAVSPEIKREVYREVLRRIERLDILRYPRKLLAMPWVGLKTALGKWWPAKPGPADGDPALSGLESGNLARLEARLLDAAEASAVSFRAESGCPGLLTMIGTEGDEPARHLRPDHKRLGERFAVAMAEFRKWAETQAQSTAATLTAEHKVKFILSQVLFNTVLIGIQVKTAGTLTLAEMLTDGILSPLAAKAVGMAVSSERVRAFEDDARREHARCLETILLEERDRWRAFLREEGEGLAALEAIAPRMDALRRAAGTLARLFLEPRAR